MAEDNRPIGSRLGDEVLKTPRAAEPVTHQAPNVLADLRRDSRDGVVVVRLDPEDPRRLNGPEAGGMGCSERDRDLPDEVAGPPLADDPLDSIDELDHLDMTLEQSEKPRLVSLVYRKFLGSEADVGRNAREPLAVGSLESREYLEPSDLLGGHHWRHRA